METEGSQTNAAAPPPATPLQRLAAGAALLLLASAALSAWWIVSDRADFRAARRDAPPQAVGAQETGP